MQLLKHRFSQHCPKTVGHHRRKCKPHVVKGNWGLYLSPAYFALHFANTCIWRFCREKNNVLMGQRCTLHCFWKSSCGRTWTWDWHTPNEFLQYGLHYSMFRRRMRSSLSWQRHYELWPWEAPVLHNLLSHQPGRSRLIYLIFAALLL